MRGENAACATAELNAFQARTLAKCGEDDFVAILQPRATFAVEELQRLGAVASKLHQAACRGAFGARQRPGCEDVAGLQVAAVARMVCSHLRRGPIEIAGV